MNRLCITIANPSQELLEEIIRTVPFSDCKGELNFTADPSARQLLNPKGTYLPGYNVYRTSFGRPSELAVLDDLSKFNTEHVSICLPLTAATISANIMQLGYNLVNGHVEEHDAKLEIDCESFGLSMEIDFNTVPSRAPKLNALFAALEKKYEGKP